MGRWVSEALTTASCSAKSSTPPVQLVIHIYRVVCGAPYIILHWYGTETTFVKISPWREVAEIAIDPLSIRPCNIHH